MTQEEEIIKTRDGEFALITWNEITDNYDDILESRVPIYRMKKDGQLTIIPATKIEQYLGGIKIEGIKFYIEREWRNRIIHKKSFIDQKEESVQNKAVEPPGDIKFDEQIKSYKQMSLKDRESSLNKNIEEMSRKVELYKKIDENVIGELVEITSSTWHINKTSLQESKSSRENGNLPDLPRDFFEKLVSKTNILVDSMVALMSNRSLKYSDLNVIENINTGSPTLDHVNRVLLRFIPFTIFYNEYFKTGKIAKIRGNFDVKFEQYYRKKEITLETVFKNGIRRLTDDELRNYCLGALLHDVGKFPTVNYYDNANTGDRKKIMSHAPYSYNMIIKTGKFSKDIAFMALLHHEYYGDPAGYNFSVQLFPKLSRKSEVSHLTNYFISYDIDDLKEGRAIAFFPAKLLEIVDLFDELISKTPGQTSWSQPIENVLKKMMEEFVMRKLIIDPVLFCIFLDFMREYVGNEIPIEVDFF